MAISSYYRPIIFYEIFATAGTCKFIQMKFSL